MQRISKKLSQHLPGYCDWRYYGTLGALALMAPVTLGTLLLLLPNAHGLAVDNGYTYGANGVLQVRGALTESACRLAMSSARQDIQLRETGTGRLQNVDDRGTPVGFELRLQDCLRSPAGSRDSRSRTLVWAAQQPAVTVNFRASSDMDNPQLVKVQGVSGLALRLTDPLGQNMLAYTVAPERTRAPLMAGAYSATVDFRLSYD